MLSQYSRADASWQCPLVERWGKANPVFSSFNQNIFPLIWKFFVPFSFFCLRLSPPQHTHIYTDRGKGVSYRDTIVCAASKGDLLKELWCAAISPTSVRTTCAGACNPGGEQGGWGVGGLEQSWSHCLLQFHRLLT